MLGWVYNFFDNENDERTTKQTRNALHLLFFYDNFLARLFSKYQKVKNVIFVTWNVLNGATWKYKKNLYTHLKLSSSIEIYRTLPTTCSIHYRTSKKHDDGTIYMLFFIILNSSFNLPFFFSRSATLNEQRPTWWFFFMYFTFYYTKYSWLGSSHRLLIDNIFFKKLYC